jgi:preprotein translocase subunit SecD
MKKNKLKVITITFFIILVTMVAFVGVYVQEKNIMENKVKDYSLAMDLNGTRNIVLKVSDETTEVIKDSNGNKVESATDEEISEKGYTKETVQKNTDDVKTLDNYKTSKEIIEKRLKKLGVENYIIKLNEQTGEIVVELTDNSQTDNVVSNLTTVGKFEIIDTNTKEVLLTNDDIKASNVVRSTTSSGTNIYFTIEFNKDGKKKLEEITKTYVPQDNTSSEESSESSENSDSSSQTTKKTITMKIDGTDVMSTDFEEPITDGIMHLSVGQAATDTKTLQENVKQANQMAAVLENKNMPVEYTLQSDTFVKSTVTEDTVAAVIIVVTVIALIALIVLFIRYKSNGLLAIISYVGLLSILLLTIRYTNVVLSIEGIAAIFVILVMNYVFENKILNDIKIHQSDKKADIKHIINMSIKDMVIKIIPIAILAITFCFMGWIPTSSFGMVMFWGITLIIIYNLLVTKNLLKTSQEK